MLKRRRFRLRIRTKLLAGFMLVAMFTGVLGLSSVITVNHLNASRDAQYRDIFGGTYLVATWANAARVAESDLSAYVLEADPAVRERLKAEMLSTDTRLAEIIDEMDRVDTDRSDTQTLATLSQAWHAYAEWRGESIMASIDLGNWVEARTAFEAEGSARTERRRPRRARVPRCKKNHLHRAQNLRGCAERSGNADCQRPGGRGNAAGVAHWLLPLA